MPYLIKWKDKILANSLSTEPIIHVDLYPTLLGLTGSTFPKNYILDGEDISPRITSYNVCYTKLLRESKGMTKQNKIREYVLERLKPSTENADVPDEAYQDGIYTKEALKKLNRLMKGDKPWFLAVGYQKPHLPFVAPKKS